MWLESSDRQPQLLETKDIAVWTRPKARPDLTTRLRQSLQSLFGTAPAFNKSYAFLVGIGKYKHLPPLSSPSQDVDRMSVYLQQQGFDEVVAIKDDSVSEDTFRQPEKYLKLKMGPDDRFLFYYSGHGMSVPAGARTRGYIPLVDEVAGGRTRSVPMDAVVEWLKSLNPQHLLVILDSCFSGLAIGGIEQKEVAATERKLDRAAFDALSQPPARYLLMAGNEHQVTFGGRQWNGSLFTDTLLRGMRKDADLFHDGIVTTRGLYVYLQKTVPSEARKAGRELTPLMMDLNFKQVSRGEFIFVP